MKATLGLTAINGGRKRCRRAEPAGMALFFFFGGKRHDSVLRFLLDLSRQKIFSDNCSNSNSNMLNVIHSKYANLFECQKLFNIFLHIPIVVIFCKRNPNSNSKRPQNLQVQEESSPSSPAHSPICHFTAASLIHTLVKCDSLNQLLLLPAVECLNEAHPLHFSFHSQNGAADSAALICLNSNQK
jgi:hypothetical protein